jgi:hypothetical protein
MAIAAKHDVTIEPPEISNNRVGVSGIGGASVGSAAAKRSRPARRNPRNYFFFASA